MTSQHSRPRIAEIMRDSGKLGADEPTASPSQLATMAAAITGGSAGMLLASQALTDELAARFHLDTEAAVERDFAHPYATAARALILGLQAAKCTLSAAFDTASGAIVEAKKGMTLLSPAFTVTIAIVDRDGGATRMTGHAKHTGLDVGGMNTKTLNAIFAKTDAYLTLFAS